MEGRDMEKPLHAGEDVGRDEMMPRIIVVIAGLVIAVIAGVGLMYSGLWSPPPTSISAQAATHH
jgi:hypothetical protein